MVATLLDCTVRRNNCSPHRRMLRRSPTNRNLRRMNRNHRRIRYHRIHTFQLEANRMIRRSVERRFGRLMVRDAAVTRGLADR